MKQNKKLLFLFSIFLVLCLFFVFNGCGSGGGNNGSVADSGDNNSACCKTCTTGKACGDSCINVNYTCSKPAGCACNE